MLEVAFGVMVYIFNFTVYLQVLPWPPVFSSHTLVYQHSAEYLRTICPYLKFPLFSSLLSCSLTCEL